MIDEISSYRLQIGLHYYRQAKVKGLNYFTVFELSIILSLLILQCGDVELNPGPDLDVSSSSEGTSQSLNQLDIVNNFSVIHYNVQSILNKIDILESEFRNFNILCFTETWLDGRTLDQE
ncbi:MAG: hypothetical protein AB2693_23135, partial [Candidatus Thiodiazotropha sp.]